MLKKVLYVGYLWDGSTCVPRLRGLRALDLDVVELDATPCFKSVWRPFDSIYQRLFLTPSVWMMNVALLEAAARTTPDVVWIEKGIWIYPSTLRKLRKYVRFIIHYNTDDVFGAKSWFWLHRTGIHLYDLHLTTNRWNVMELRDRCGVRTLRAGMGYDQDFHRPVRPDKQCAEKVDVVFVGHWEPHTERYITALREAGLRVHVCGHNWRKAKDPKLSTVMPLAHTDYVETISNAKIALCILSRWNRNESTGRSFEIPAIGTCMLAERTAEHMFLYGDDEGALLFSDERELVEKARRYLGDDTARQKVRCVGHARCKELGMSWGDHVRREWPLLENLLCGDRMTENGAADHPFWNGYRDGRPFPGEMQNRSSMSKIAG